MNLDDRLRLVPGFSLFRRSSSLVANPTTQGVSLRGLGSTGASRTLILWDGIPLNDPFGGWVYWTRIDPAALERVEVSRGASTSLFGDRALGGAVSLFTRPAAARRFRAALEGGNAATILPSMGFSELFGKFAMTANARGMWTEGFFIVPERYRGRVDERADSDFLAGDTKLDLFLPRGTLALKFDALAESRGNGTSLQENASQIGTVSANYALDTRAGTLNVLGYHARQAFRATFSSISADRDTERLTSRQAVPSNATGGAALFRARRFVAGADAQRVEGTSTDYLVPSGTRVGGGSVLQHGYFAQADIKAGPLRFFGGVRQQFTGLATGAHYFLPSGGVTADRGRWRWRASAYRAFRAPTLNELYREFRAGNTVTYANSRLIPETLTGVESGIDFTGERTRIRLTAFRNKLGDLITNVTLAVRPTLIERQRQNFGGALSRGVEADVVQSLGPLRAELSYLFADSRFDTGERLPQVPRHQGSGQLIWQRGGTLLAAGARASSLAFDDDRNLFPLAGFAVAHAVLRQRLGLGWSATATLENALGREFYVAATPVPQNGTP
ncbi:MAG: TonB-dependent receptor, partial [Bryobacter sp.]|nr:TonB-dependent receptor [Bryobacter sp.]